jgi:hypothetical protein
MVNCFRISTGVTAFLGFLQNRIFDRGHAGLKWFMPVCGCNAEAAEAGFVGPGRRMEICVARPIFF